MRYVIGLVVLGLAGLVIFMIRRRPKYEPSPEATAFRRSREGDRFTDVTPLDPDSPAPARKEPKMIDIGVGTVLLVLGIIIVLVVGAFVWYNYAPASNIGATVNIKLSLWQMFEIFLAIVMFFIIVAWAIWQDAKVGGLFKFVGLNQIATFDGGDDQPVKVAANLPDEWIVKGLKIVPGGKLILNPIRILMRKYGIFWKGFPTKTHIWTFIHERLNPKRDDNTPVIDWVKRDEKATPSDYFLFEKPHWVAAAGLEFKGGFRAHLLVQYWSRTRGLGSLYKLGGNVYPPMNAAVLAQTKTQCGLHSYEDFITLDTDGTSTEPDNFCLNIAQGANEVSMREVEQEIYDVSVLFYDAADAETARLASARNAAEINLEVARLNAAGSVADVTELAKQLRELFPNADPNTAMQAVAELGKYDRLARLTNLRAIGAGALIGLGDEPDTPKGGKPNATGKGGGKRGKK